MEGPSLYLAQQQLKPFKKQVVRSVAGNTSIEKERFVGRQVKDLFSWGKHLLFQFDAFALKVHFLLFGTFTAVVDGVSVTGDYKKTQTPRLTLEFPNGRIDIYNGSVKILEEKNLKKLYDFSIDVMSPKWDAKKALRHLQEFSSEEIADVLLDQDVFAGVGNIIKNEILSLAYVNPMTRVEGLPLRKQKELVQLAHDFSHQFYRWRKKFVLRKHLLIHRKSLCPHCGGKVTHQKTGRRERWSHYCPACQPMKNDP